MGFLDKLQAGASIVADKAKEGAEVAKQKLTIVENEKNIKDVYTEIGKSLVASFPELAAEKFPEAMEKIKGFEAVIEAARAALAKDDPAEEAKAAEEAKPEE